ncbi:Kinetochore-associated protein 1 [Dufourea novaeangliae]|uniref:Kinetochore-associated protein 1 n=1 Tax=Dufourea novaeangliae TaxID=178035 RepID=A0A154PF93_DUFNO|nr:Kinetochore-associated protein 1 [Dufourea novaeangliae]
MALWNKVLSGFDKEEETVNFGTRTVAENNGSLYEISTIATIQSDGKVETEPSVLASVQYSRVCVVIDKSITIFENETCKEILLSVSFGLLISCYYISDNGTYLFVVLSNGVLYCLNLLSKGQIIFTKVSKFNLNLIEVAILNDTNVTIKEVIEQIECTELFKGFSNNEVIYAAVGIVSKEISVAMLCSNMLFMWPNEQYNNFSTVNYNYTKVKFFKNHMAMLCLCIDNTLNIVCPRTLLGLKVYHKPVSDFVIIENTDSSSCLILILTVNDDQYNKYTLRVLSFPDFELKFQINVPITTYLVEIMDPRDEIILFLEGINNFQNDTKYIDTIRIKAVSESLPEYQFQRLIRREQFNRAEVFARNFNLSMEPIYCAKASLLISQLGPWAKKGYNLIQLNELLSLFDKIQNVQYVVECCSKALIPQHKQMRQIYLYARTRITEDTTNTKTDNHLNLLCLINNTLHKLETFHLIWGHQKDFDYYDDDTMKEWIRFSRVNFIEEYKTHLSLGEMEAATLIWTRHLPDIMVYISEETVRDILTTLPERISPSNLWPWLSHFIPTLLSIIPGATREIILWGCKKIKSFEQSHRSAWPQIGIDFAEKFIKLFRYKENRQLFDIHRECLSKDSNVKQLVLLIQAMSDIKKLKVNYRLAISLDAYIGDPVKVSYMLLDKIYVDIIPDFVNTFLKQYMLNNSLDNDYIFSSYIQKIITNSKNWWSGEEAPWEKRVVVVISLIQNVETRLQQTLEILRKASVPWSSSMVNIAEISSNLDHTLASQVRIEFNSVPIKLILKKYGYERIGINDKLIYRIIKENHESMISHIQQITKNDPLLRKKAFSSCINYYLALPKCVEHYVEMLGWVKLQLEEISQKLKAQSHFCNSVIINIDEIKAIYILKKEFQISVTMKEYQLKKKQILQTYIEKLHNEKNGNFVIMYRQIMKVADLLEIQRLDAVSLLLEQTKNIDVFKYFTRFEEGQVSLTPDECAYMYRICLTMLQYTEMDEDIATTIHNLCTTALCVCADGKLQPMLLLVACVRLYQECFNKNTAYSSNSLDSKQEEISKTNWQLYTIYNDLAIAADELLLPLFKDMIFVQQYYTAKPESDTENLIINETVENFNQEPLKNFLDKIRKLKVEHNDYCLLRIIKTLYFNFCIVSDTNSALITEIKTLYDQFLIILLKKVISTRAFDLPLGLSCMFTLSKLEAYKWISATSKAYQSNCTRHFRLSILGYEYFNLSKNQSLMQTYKDNKMLHYWAQKLSKYSISYKEILTSDAIAKREILQRVMNYSNDDMTSLFQDFCTNFSFDIQDCLLIYLQTIVMSWNPKLNTSNINGKKELRIDESEVKGLENKCTAIAAKISDKVALKNCVTTTLSQVNFYHYEVFIILMDLIEDTNIQHRNYFCFLQNYTRNSQPTQIERDEWMHLNPGYTCLPPIAEWRLPFLPKVELWTLITPELNLKSLEMWLDIAPILKLQPHIICTLAIKGEITRTWGTKQKTGKWSLCSKNSSLLNDIKKCIERMTGPKALYYGTAALYYVVNHTPPGADQVAAVEECYKYAQLSVQNSTKFEEGMLEKIKFKYLHFTSEHILRTHGLGNSNYLSLIGNPHKLVRELYKDESISQRYRCVIDHRPDINSAVNAICELFSINMIKLRMELLQEWLQPDTKYIKFNQSVMDTFSITNSESNSNSDDNLLRACYILEYGDLELSANFLINIGFGDGNEDYSPEARYRALHVLQTIVDTAKLEDLTKRDIQTIRNHMKSLKYIGKLESLGVDYSTNTFEACSKHELVQILWKTQRYSSQALVFIAQICIDFEIYEYTLWDNNLTQIAKLLMIDELKKILLQVRNRSVIINCNGYLLGWQAVISEPFRKMDHNPTSEQINNCLETLQLLYSCPVVHMLCFNDTIKYCFQCQQPHLAAALLPFLNGNDKNDVLEKIKNTSNVPKILEDLNNLSLNGILCVPYVSIQS